MKRVLDCHSLLPENDVQRDRQKDDACTSKAREAACRHIYRGYRLKSDRRSQRIQGVGRPGHLAQTRAGDRVNRDACFLKSRERANVRSLLSEPVFDSCAF